MPVLYSFFFDVLLTYLANNKNISQQEDLSANYTTHYKVSVFKEASAYLLMLLFDTMLN